MGRTLQNLINKKHGSSAPRWVYKMRTNTCFICMFKQRKKARVAGMRLMLTKNFGARGQVDLIDYSATPDSPQKYLLNYRDHGIKIATAKPVT